MSSGEPSTRQKIIEAAFGCVDRWGIEKTTLDDVARYARLSRATVYRHFPGGREEVVQAVIAWQAASFLTGLYEAIHGAESLQELLVRFIGYARKSLKEHAVLNKVLSSEADVLLPKLTTEADLLAGSISGVLVPYLSRFGIRKGLPVREAADYLSRMLFSYTSSPGQWNLEDPAQVADLVRVELLGGIGAS